jgi:predicted ATPase
LAREGSVGRRRRISCPYPGAALFLLSKDGLAPVALEETEHFRLIREFCMAPATFIDSALAEDE